MAIIFDNRGRPIDGSLEIGGVTFQRQDRVLHGLAADRPTAAAAHAQLPFAYYNAVDTQVITQTDGTNWVTV